MATTQPTEEKNGNPAPARASRNSTPLTANGYIAAVMRMRDSHKPRERALLLRVVPEERAKAEEMLAKLG
jgi:hypothetical protein